MRSDKKYFQDFTSVRRNSDTYTKRHGERGEVGGQQTEGQVDVVDEAVLHITIRGVPHKVAALCSIQVHHFVALKERQTHITLHLISLSFQMYLHTNCAPGCLLFF